MIIEVYEFIDENLIRHLDVNFHMLTRRNGSLDPEIRYLLVIPLLALFFHSTSLFIWRIRWHLIIRSTVELYCAHWIIRLQIIELLMWSVVLWPYSANLWKLSGNDSNLYNARNTKETSKILLVLAGSLWHNPSTNFVMDLIPPDLCYPFWLKEALFVNLEHTTNKWEGTEVDKRIRVRYISLIFILFILN